MEWHSETELLRMTKDELIRHIFYLYDVYEAQFKDLVLWSTAFEQMEELRQKHREKNGA